MIHHAALWTDVCQLVKKLSERQLDSAEILKALLYLLEHAGSHSATEDALMSRWHRLSPKALNLVAARPVETPELKVPVPPRPSELTLCASDGSQVFPDRNLNLDFFLLNLSRIAFHIGTNEPPLLESTTELYDDEFTAAFDLDLGDRNITFATPEIIAALRGQRELETLFDLALQEKKSGRPCLALADGTLICWHLKNLREPMQSLLRRRYLSILSKFREAKIPVASYVSYPGSKEVRATLGLVLQAELKEHALPLERLTDHQIFCAYLNTGERSALFASMSEAMNDYDSGDKIYFFYLRLPHEIARIELPAWVASEIDFLHAAIFDDATKGGGYPMTLTEAHEQAAVGHGDQQSIYQLIERIGMREGFPVTYSAKALSKRTAKI
ncbi:MAG: DNA double-strand break repair nuclease NurA [Rhizobacter sp.]|nr:DNA double-strand break repair nuclease NurA [Chlorobiales bacterium]